VEISGYLLSEWISDIKTKIEILSRKDEERNLKAMEDKLVKLLSDGKKVELELNEIESLLN
jgi:nucleoid DNA-binding protein